jgi:tRNA U54 and U55 pseudouridine synthase Pus10
MENLKDNFCKGCLFIFKNANTIECQGEATELAKQSDIITDKKDCKFCMGIFNEALQPYICDKVLQELGNYDFEDYRVGTNFSSLFAIIHHYVNFFLILVEALFKKG